MAARTTLHQRRMGHHKQTDKKIHTRFYRTQTKQNPLPHYLSGGLFRCPICGASMCYQRGVSKKLPRAYPYFCCLWKYAKGIHPENVNASAPKTEEALLNSLQEFVDHGHSDITYTVEKVEEPSGNDKHNMNSCLINLPSGNNVQKKHTLTVSIPKRNTGKTGNLIDAEVKSIKEKLATLETLCRYHDNRRVPRGY